MGIAMNVGVGLYMMAIVVGIIIPLLVYIQHDCTNLYDEWSEENPCDHFRVLAALGDKTGKCVKCGADVDLDSMNS